MNFLCKKKKKFRENVIKVFCKNSPVTKSILSPNTALPAASRLSWWEFTLLGIRAKKVLFDTVSSLTPHLRFSSRRCWSASKTQPASPPTTGPLHLTTATASSGLSLLPHSAHTTEGVSRAVHTGGPEEGSGEKPEGESRGRGLGPGRPPLAGCGPEAERPLRSHWARACCPSS